MHRILSALALLIVVSGCSAGPDYSRPVLETPAAWRYAEKDAQNTADTAWWRLFKDPDLDGLIAKAVAQSLDLMAATARVEEYYGKYGVARSGFFPKANAQATAGQQKVTERGASPVPATVPNPSDLFAMNLSASWELDVWGKIRRSNEAARADLLGAEEYRKAVLLTLVSSAASGYVYLCDLDKQLAIAERTVKTREDSLRLFELRHKGGVVSDLELFQVRSLYEEALATIPAIQQAIARQEHALCVLCGLAPGPIARIKSMDDLVLPEVPAGLPSDVLTRRPDIRKAEQDLMAANARIGVAKAQYFPSISLTGTFGWASTELSHLFTNPATAWNWAGQAVGPIFTAGALAGQVKQAEAVRQEALAQYKKAVIAAFSEVDDALVSHQKMREQHAIQTRQVESLRDYVRVARLRYDNGYTSYLEVLDADRSLFNAELARTQTKNALFQSLVSLYKAMGGGWVDEAGKMEQ